MSATTVTERTYIGPAFADAKVFDAMRVGVVTCRRRCCLVCEAVK